MYQFITTQIAVNGITVEAIISIIGSIIGVIGAYFLFKQKYLTYKTELAKRLEKVEEEKEELEIRVKDLSAPMLLDIKAFNEIRLIVDKMFEETSVSRYLILVAVNGKASPKRATAVYEQHKGIDAGTLSIGATHRYVNFKFDDKYKEMLKFIENHGSVYLETNMMEEQDLKRIYEYEKVLSSKVIFYMRTPIDTDNDRLWYSSAASHQGSMSEQERGIIKAYSDQIREKLKTFR